VVSLSGEASFAARGFAGWRAFPIALLLLAGLTIPGFAQTATPAATFLSFNAAQIGVSAGSAQTLTASFAISGASGGFTPTATLHYGHDYALGAVSCSGGGSETCTVPVTFQPTLPGARKDAIFLMNGSTRLATVLLNGVGQGPMSLVQPGAFTTSIPSSVLSTSGYNYIYQSVAGENGTVYLLPSGNASFIISVTKAGVAALIPLAHAPYWWTIGIDGAGVLYLFDEAKTVTTYDTVQGIQGTYVIPYTGTDTDWYPGTIDGLGNFYIVDQISNNGEIHEFNANRTSNYDSVLNPRVLQPFTIAVDSQGNAFVGGYEIDEISSTGATSQVNTVGAWDGLGVDAADTLYATRYSPTGGVAELPASNYSTPIASIDKSSSPLGVSLGSDGTVFVSNYVNLDVFDRSTTETIDFGQVSSTSFANDSTASIYNGGNEPLTISLFSLTGAGFSVDSSQPNDCISGMTLQPGALCQVTTTFTPGHPGTFSGTITIESNSLNGSNVTQTILLTGTSDGSYDVLSPNPLTFPSQAAGTSATLPVTMTNLGVYYSSTIYSISVDNPAFTVAYGTCATVTGAGASCQLQVSFKPAAATSYTGTATIVTYVSGTSLPSQTLTLSLNGTGTGPAAATPAITPGTGSYSSSQSVTITDATAGATIYYTTDGSAPTTASTKYTGAITVSSNETLNAIATATGYAQSTTATATYTFVYPAVTLTPPSIAFGNQTVNTTSGSQTVTLTNSGAASLSITSIALTGANPGSFAQTNTCGATLAAGASCNIAITFAPTTVASFSAALAVTDNASGSPHTVALGGSGTAAPAPVAVLTPASLSFGNVGIGGTGPEQIATLKNTGTAALSITGIAITGANPAAFLQTNTCGASLAAGASCAISVTFTPATVASFSATLSVTDNATGSPHQVALTGAGIVEPTIFSIAPTSLAFGNQVVNTTSASQTVTLTNTSATDTVTISSSTSSDSAFVDAADTCHASIAPGGSCHFLMVFNPKAVQAYSATVNLQVVGVSCAACSYPAQTFTVTGTGIAQPPIFTPSPVALSFGSQIVNITSAQQTVTLTNSSSSVTVSIGVFTLSDPAFADAGDSCTGELLAPGATCFVRLTFTPTAIKTYTATISFPVNPISCPACTYPVQSIPVSGTGIAQPPVLAISPASLNFGNQILNTRSATQAVTLTNISPTDTVELAGYGSSDSAYADVADNCHAAIAPGASCQLQMTFFPTALGPDNAAVTLIVGFVSCSACIYPKQTFTVTGTGIAEPPVFAISPAAVAFANQAVGTTSAPQSVTLTNTSKTDTIMLSELDGSVSDFPVPAACEVNIAPGGSCTFTVLFRPAAPQAYAGLVRINAQSINCPACTFPPQTVALSGTGVAPVITPSPTSLTFTGTQGSAIPAQTVTATNTGNDALTFSGIALVGANSSAFNQTNNCPSSLATGASCTISVSFIASAAGSFSAKLNFLGTGPSGASASASVPLSGTLYSQGPVMTVSPASLDFGNQPLGIEATKLVTLTNSSATDSVYLSSTITSDDAIRAGATLCANPIAPGASCTLPISFDPTAPQSYSGTITFQMKGSSCAACNYPAQSFAVKGAGVGPVITLSPTSLTFSAVYLSTAAPQTVNVTNTGTEALLISNIGINGKGGAFTQTNNCPSSVAVGASCTVTVTFTATNWGDQTGGLAILGNGPDGALAVGSVALTGHEIAINGQASFTPASLSFSAVAGNSSAAQTTTLTNTGNVPLKFIDFPFFGASPSAYAQTNNCPATLAVGATCQFSVTFAAPSSQGIYTAQLNANAIDPDAGPVTPVLSVSGNATPQIAAGVFSPGSLSFSSIALVNSAAQTATLTNTGNEPITVSNVQIFGTNPNEFSQTNTCTQAIPVGGSCTFSITFTPLAAGTFSEQLVASLATPNGSHDNAFLFFSGTAQPNVSTGTLSTTSLTFSTTAGTTSAAQSATLTNTGNLTLLIASISLAGDNPNDYKESDNCGLNLAVGASCTISVTFTPTSLGSYPATVVINDNDPTSPQTITLSGNGVSAPDFVVASSVPSLSVALGASAKFAVTVSATGGATIPRVSLSATGLPPGATASFATSSVTPGSTSATTTLTIDTKQTLAGTRQSWPGSARSAVLPALALLGWFFVPRKQRRRWTTLGLLLFASLAGVAALTGCGGGFNLIPPAKTYTVTVTASIGSVQQTTNVQLTVQ